MSSSAKRPIRELPPQVTKISLLVATWSLFGVCVLFFIARIAVRLTVSRRLYLDDAWATAALIILLGLAISLTLAIPSMYQLLRVGSGLEMPGPTLKPDSTYYLKLQFALTILYWSCLWAVKACFLSFFHRLTKGLKYCELAWWVTVAITTLSYFGCIITYPVSCSSFVLGECESDLHVYRSLVSLRYSTVVDLVTDAMIIALPLYLALRVRLPLVEKVALASIFSLGGVIMLFAIIRIAVTNQHNTHPETSWLNLWSQIEASVAVIISTLAPFKTLFTNRKKSSYHPSNSSARRNATSKGLRSEASFGNRAIPLDDRSHAYAQNGNIAFAEPANSTEQILPIPHIVKTLEIEQHAY